ncbi:hypothetical protein AAVH_16564 [Aphelenchoides avenae]|nr:hypothetical protein AAVH_16564 [Aphelenchus avenae]
MDEDGLGDRVENLVHEMKTAFIESKAARRYVVKIFVNAYDGPLGHFVNKITSEKLVVRYVTDPLREYVEAERKRNDED